MIDDDQFLADLHALADRAHDAAPEAAAPPPNTWQRVLAAINAELLLPSEGTPSMTTPFAQPVNTLWGSPPTAGASPRGLAGHIRRYANLSAIIALVVVVAVGSWLAMMQVQPDGPDPRLAVLQATPEGAAQACDVEPLTVDEAMAIVRNPVPFMRFGVNATPEVIPETASESAGLYELTPDLELIEGNQVPTEDQFDAVSTIAIRYVNCMAFGTQGQVWRFYSPAYVQKTVLAEFPVFAEESQVRERVEERLNEPAYEGEAVWKILPFIDDIEMVSVNPDYQLAILQASESSYFDQVMNIGVVVKDVDDETLIQTNGTGRNLIPNDPLITGRSDIQLHVVLAKSRNSDAWFVIPWPSEAQLGWPKDD